MSFVAIEAGWYRRQWCAEDVVAAVLVHQPDDRAAHARKAHLRSLADDLERLHSGRGSERVRALTAQIHAKIAVDLTPAPSRRLLLRLTQQAILARLGRGGEDVVNG